MSFDTVKARIIELNPDANFAKLDENILNSIKRFEKIARVEHKGLFSRRIWRTMTRKGETLSQTQTRCFEEHKPEFIHQYLTMLIDLYDYKPKAE